MNKNTFNVFIGTLPPPTGGQAIISKEIIDKIEHQLVINTTYSNFILFWFNYIRLMIIFIWNIRKITTIYTVISRGKISIWRELIFLIICKYFKNIKVINHLHGNDFEWIFNDNFYSKIIYNLYVKCISLTICVNDYQQVKLKSAGIQCIKILNPIVNINLHTTPSKTYYKRNYTFGYISFIMSTKGIFDVLELIINELKRGENISLIIAGEIKGDEELSFSETKRKFNLKIAEANKIRKDSVKYIGVVSGKEKESFYQSFNFLLFLSRFKSESFGLVLIEAMSFGVIPIINNNETLLKTLTGFNFLKLNEIMVSNLKWNIFTKEEIENNRLQVINKHNPSQFINKLKKHYV